MEKEFKEKLLRRLIDIKLRLPDRSDDAIWVAEGLGMPSHWVSKADPSSWRFEVDYNEKNKLEKWEEADTFFVHGKGWDIFCKISDYNRTWGFDPRELVINRARLLADHLDPEDAWREFLERNDYDYGRAL